MIVIPNMNETGGTTIAGQATHLSSSLVGINKSSNLTFSTRTIATNELTRISPVVSPFPSAGWWEREAATATLGSLRFFKLRLAAFKPTLALARISVLLNEWSAYAPLEIGLSLVYEASSPQIDNSLGLLPYTTECRGTALIQTGIRQPFPLPFCIHGISAQTSQRPFIPALRDRAGPIEAVIQKGNYLVTTKAPNPLTPSAAVPSKSLSANSPSLRKILVLPV
ncbi:hypothetical protein IFM89_009783 [Coptis chinensis]|uniref:Uncharacterized protein n=1 Tax=Coptis chinensis TaxID=261450 RepID=A0A835I1M1_9MAGN|nr:hypothetical protein IFM89_009783 [Coptis chinensis]